MIVDLIGATTTLTGLRVRAELDRGSYPIGVKVSDAELVLEDEPPIITTPDQAAGFNGFAERWVQTVRQECLDWVLIWGGRHLERVLDEYVRPYQIGLGHGASYRRWSV